MQNTPEAVYLCGGCVFTDATLVGINNAQVGEKLATDGKNMDIEVLFADDVEQPKTGRTFLEALLEAHRRYDLGSLYPDYIIARQRQARNHPASMATIWNSVGDPVTYILSTVGGDADFSHLPLRTVISTGTNAANRAAFSRIFGLDIFAEAYGSTEVGAIEELDGERYIVSLVRTGTDRLRNRGRTSPPPL